MIIPMDGEKQLIPSITTQSKHWTVRITICEEIPEMLCSSGSRLKRYIFCDSEGNQTLACIYDPDLDTLCPMLHLYEVYDISNADVKLTNQVYQVVSHPFHWIIKRETLIQPVPDATPNLHFMLLGLTPLIDLPNAARNKQITADVMGVVIDHDEVRHVKSGLHQVQHFTIVDYDLIPIRITLWDDNIAAHGPALMEAAKNNSVIIAKRMALRTYDSTSLSPRNASAIAVDPPLHTVGETKSWFQTIDPAVLENIRAKNTTSFTKELVTAGRMKTYQVAELKTTDKVGDYWARGYIHLLDEDQQLYYVSCSSCQKKARAKVDDKYNCFLCKSEAIATLRPVVILSVLDQSGDMEITALDQTAERILQTTAQAMKNLHEKGEKLDLGSIKEDLKSKRFLLHLKKTPASIIDSNLRMVLQAYYDEDAPQSDNTAGSSNSTAELAVTNKEAELPLSPLKRQLDAITITTTTPTKKKFAVGKSPEQTMKDPANKDSA